jgi:hypothetical protein
MGLGSGCMVGDVHKCDCTHVLSCVYICCRSFFVIFVKLMYKVSTQDTHILLHLEQVFDNLTFCTTSDNLPKFSQRASEILSLQLHTA